MPIRAVITCFLALGCMAVSQRMAFARYFGEDINKIGADLPKIIYWGLRFDAAIAAFLTLVVVVLVYLMTRFTASPHIYLFRPMTGLCGAFLLGLFAIDGAYFSLYQQHADARIFQAKEPLIDLGIDWVFVHWPLFLLQIVSLGLLLAYLYRVYAALPNNPGLALRFAWWPVPWWPVPWWPELRIAFVLLVGLILIRGGFQSTPLKPIHAYGIGDKQLFAYSQSGAYQLLHTGIKHSYIETPPLAMKPGHETDFKRLLPRLADTPPDTATFKPRNIIFLLLNQWTAVNLASYGYHKSTTPFFDQLRQQSLSVATLLAGNTQPEENIFSLFCGTQAPLEGRIADSELYQLNFQCLPDLLRLQGYNTAFIQGSRRYVGDLASIAQFVGFEQLLSLRDIKQRQYNLNPGGVHDPDLYRFALQQMDIIKPPFAIAIHTNSTAFTELPSNWVGEFPVQEKHDETLNILNFADNALQDFIEQLQQKPFANNTVLVLLGDRAVPNSGKGAASETPLLTTFSIPFAIYAPRLMKPRLVDVIAGPRDVSPTLLDILGLPVPTHSVGHSLVNPGKTPFFADYYLNGTLGWIEAKAVVEFPLQDPARVKCYTHRANADPVSRTCNEATADMVQRALGFTAMSQQLLLLGRLERFESLK